MRAFTMNLLNYNANTMSPAGGAAHAKHLLLAAELQNYQNNVIGAAIVNVAGFTEVFVADGANQNNVINALDHLGIQLAIPPAAGGRYVAVLRCGYSALQPNGNEVVAIVLDGNAINVQYYVASFNPPQGLPPPWTFTNVPGPAALPPAVVRYTAYLQRPALWVADYRYIVGVTFQLGGVNYHVGFFHNRQPGAIEGAAALGRARQHVEAHATMLLGGDFNATPGCINANPCRNGMNHQLTYYSTLANTTVANNYDWWMSLNTFHLGPFGALNPAQCNATPTAPTADDTGSDHRGVGIEIGCGSLIAAT